MVLCLRLLVVGVLAASLVDARTCPFKRLNQKAEKGITLENAQTAIKARALAETKFCGPPLCKEDSWDESKTGRRLLSTAKLRSNGYPELYSTTLTSIETDFCSVLNGGCEYDSNGDNKGIPSGYKADFDRADVTAGAIQLAFHDAGEYDPNNATYPGGPDGCACDKKEENAGLDYIKGILEPIYEKYEDYLSLADFWVIVANVAVVASKQQSSVDFDMDFKYGRSDHSDCDACTLSVANRLPNAELSTDHVREVFQDRMGFTDQEIVALMGAHSLGTMEFANSGHVGTWDQTWAQLDKRYYIAILSFTWCRYYVNQTGSPYHNDEYFHEWRVPNSMDYNATYFDTSQPKLLNTDMCLGWDIGDGDDVNDGTCPSMCMSGDIWDDCGTAMESGDTTKSCGSDVSTDSPSGTLTICEKQSNGMRTYVETYASNDTAFLLDFAAAFKKLTELGQDDLEYPTEVEAPSDLTYSECTSTCKMCTGFTVSDMFGSDLVPSAEGSTVTAYSAADLPAGLSIDSTTGYVSGTPSETSDSTAYTVTATNDAGSDTVNIRIKVLDGSSSNNCPSPTPAPTSAESTPTSAPTAAASCESWCSSNSNDWDTKCSWAKCSGCDDCSDDSSSSEDTPTEAPTYGDTCYSWCESNSNDWDTKCAWTKCSGCADCSELLLASKTTDNWSENLGDGKPEVTEMEEEDQRVPEDQWQEA